jgi:acyl carrier protein
MKNRRFDPDTLLSQLKHLIADMFRPDLLDPEKIGDNEPLLGGRLGLDSLDALELAIRLEEVFGLRICLPEEWHQAFASIAVLADSIRTHVGAKHARPHHKTAVRIIHPVLTSPATA